MTLYEMLDQIPFAIFINGECEYHSNCDRLDEINIIDLLKDHYLDHVELHLTNKED